MNADAPRADVAQAINVDPAVREALRGLRRQTESVPRRTALPDLAERVRQVGADEDLVRRFEQAATAAGAHVHLVSQTDQNPGRQAGARLPAGGIGPRADAKRCAWIAKVRELLQARGAKTALLATARPDSALNSERRQELVMFLAADGIAEQSTPDDETLFSVDAAITDVSAAIAETGTIVCVSGPGLARGASLIPPVHIAVVAAQQILPDLYDYLEQIGADADLPASHMLISGPSKTADIEGVLVTGMHGPGELHVIVLM